MSRRIKVGVSGGLGRMGRTVIPLLDAHVDVELTAICHRPGTEGTLAYYDSIGERALVRAGDALERCDVIIDFTTPEASLELIRSAGSRGGPALVIGTTGMSDRQEAEVSAAATSLPIVRSGNFSLGLNMLVGLVEIAARQLKAREWDIEVVEAHHRSKADAPSGTALMLANAAAQGRGVDLAAVANHVRNGLTGARTEGTIGFSAIRGGGIVGEHSVLLAAEDELLTLSHSARHRSLFARGAIEAAIWVVNRNKPGIYSMLDVLGFRDTTGT
jgi:4-hydroxy-tetrahydrodipicolinate reductase